MKIKFLPVLLSSCNSVKSSKSFFYDFLSAVVVIFFVGVISWRISISLGSPLVITTLYAVPVALSGRSLTLAVFGFFAAVILGVVVLEGSAHSKADLIAFLFSGVAVMSAVFFYCLRTGERLQDLRSAIQGLRSYTKRYSSALDKAGICFIVLDKNFAWIGANEASWSATGCDLHLLPHFNGSTTRLEDEVVSVLMHSGSWESWRSMLESIRADIAASDQRAWSPRLVTLFSTSDNARKYLFTVSQGDDDEFVFLGVPASEELISSH